MVFSHRVVCGARDMTGEIGADASENDQMPLCEGVHNRRPGVAKQHISQLERREREGTITHDVPQKSS